MIRENDYAFPQPANGGAGGLRKEEYALIHIAAAIAGVAIAGGVALNGANSAAVAQHAKALVRELFR